MNTARFKPSHFVYNDRINDPRYTVSSSSPSASGDSTLFAGKELEKSSGLYNFEARFDNTFLGRFTTMDPMGEKYYSISPYAYCAGNPVNLVDPEGTSWYYSINNGTDLGQIDDGDDNIYMLTEDQIKKANGDYEIWQSLRDLDYFSNNFLQIVPHSDNLNKINLCHKC